MTNRDKLFEDRYFEKKNNEELAAMLNVCCSDCVVSDYCKSADKDLTCQETIKNWLEMEQSNE